MKFDIALRKAVVRISSFQYIKERLCQDGKTRKGRLLYGIALSVQKLVRVLQSPCKERRLVSPSAYSGHSKMRRDLKSQNLMVRYIIHSNTTLRVDNFEAYCSCLTPFHIHKILRRYNVKRRTRPDIIIVKKGKYIQPKYPA